MFLTFTYSNWTGWCIYLPSPLSFGVKRREKSNQLYRRSSTMTKIWYLTLVQFFYSLLQLKEKEYYTNWRGKIIDKSKRIKYRDSKLPKLVLIKVYDQRSCISDGCFIEDLRTRYWFTVFTDIILSIKHETLLHRLVSTRE